MEGAMQRWSLRDFGTIQFLWDALSGEYIKVYGRGAVRHNGPWKLVVSEDGSELVSLAGEGGGVARLDPEEVASFRIHLNVQGELMVGHREEDDKSKLMPLHTWQDANALNIEYKALVLPVDG
jgi:hypothetical protein